MELYHIHLLTYQKPACMKNYLINDWLKMLAVVLESVAGGLMKCWHTVADHLASYTVCTCHLINQMLCPKSQQYTNLLFFNFKTSVLKDFYYVFSQSICFLLDVILESTRPSSLFKPIDCLSSLLDNKDSIYMLTSWLILAPSKMHMVIS